MRKTKEVLFGETRITCREMLVSEVRDWLSDLARVEPDIIGDDLLEGITLTELARMSDFDVSKAGGFAPSEVQQIADACKECNPHFFALRARLWDRARALSHALTPPPAPSSALDTATSGRIPIASS